MTQDRLPPDFELRLKEILPQRPASIFEPRQYQAFRINTLKISVEEAHALLSNRKVDFQKVDFCPYAIIVEKSAAQELLKSDLVNDGLLYAQGLESILAGDGLRPAPQSARIGPVRGPGQ